MGGDGRIDQISAQTPKTRQRPILVGASQPAVSDYVGNQNRRELPGLAHGAIAEAGRSQVAVALAWLRFPCCA
jgi:hypothetical protein